MKYKYLNNLSDTYTLLHEIIDGEKNDTFSSPEFSNNLCDFLEKNKDVELDYICIGRTSKERYAKYHGVNVVGFILKKLKEKPAENFEKTIMAIRNHISDDLFTGKDFIQMSDEEIEKLSAYGNEKITFDPKKTHRIEISSNNIFTLFVQHFTDKIKEKDYRPYDEKTEAFSIETERFIKNFNLLFDNPVKKSTVDYDFFNKSHFYNLLQLDHGLAFSNSMKIIDTLFSDNRESAYLSLFSALHLARSTKFNKQSTVNYNDYLKKIKEMPFFSYDKIPGSRKETSFISDLYARGSWDEIEKLEKNPDIKNLLFNDFNNLFLEKVENYIFENTSYGLGLSMTSHLRNKMLEKIKEDMLDYFRPKLFEDMNDGDIIEKLHHNYLARSGKNSYTAKRFDKFKSFYKDNYPVMFRKEVEIEKNYLTQNIEVSAKIHTAKRI